MTQKIENRSDACPACESAKIDNSVEYFDGICNNCGIVLDDTNSVALEWEITNGKLERSEEKAWMSACRIRNSTEQQLAQAFETIEDLSVDCGLSAEIRKGAADLYCDAFRSGITDGRRTTSMVAACLCLASREAGQPIPRSRLAEYQDVDAHKCHLCHLALCDKLDIESRTPDPQDYIPFFQDQLGLTDVDRQEVQQLLSSVRENQELIGKNPAGIAAGAVYILLDDITQNEAGKAVGLSCETVRKRVNQLRGSIKND